MRETRYLWVGNLPENIREEKLVEYFKRYGRIERAKILSKRGSDNNFCAVVAFVDIRSAQEAQASVNMMGDRQLQTNYSEPTAISSSSRHPDASPLRHNTSSSSHRNYAGHRADNTKSFEGHSGERGYVTDRYRTSHSTKYRGEYSEPRGSQKYRELRDYDSGSSSNTHSLSKPEKKSTKVDIMKTTKVKAKRQQHEEEKPVKKASKVTKQKERGRSPVKKSSIKKRQEVVSSSDEDDSSSSYSSGSSQPSSSESSESSSLSSSRSNSSSSSSSRSSVESEQEGQKMVTIIIKKLPSRPSGNNLRDGIYHEFKKCGKVKSLVIRGDNVSRHALVLFRNAAEANKAINHAKTKLLFGAAIEASIYEGEVSGKELQECGGIIDEFHPRASRTLFVGNLDKTVQHSDIQNIFVRFGEILALEIKKQNSIPQYAFLQYTDIASVVKAMQKMDGEKLGRNSLKLGFGKTVMSSCVWVDGVTDSFTEKYLASCFAKYGVMKHVVIDRSLGQALVFYTEYKHSQQAISGMRARKLNGSRLKLDYASHEFVDLFLTRMRNSGQSATTFENIRNLLLPAPNASGVPPSNSSMGGSRSRSTSGHPYSGGGDSYYEDVHPSRYHGPPQSYDSGAPPRGDWRPWEDRNRGRPVYQSISPRNRRYNDDRGPDYYHREDDYYDRVPGGRYDPDYRHPDYRRDHGRDYLPRGYEDYHRGVKQRDRRDMFHHSRPGVSPARGLPRRSRSISPRSTGSGGRARGREFDAKGEARLMDHRDHSAPHTRSPIQSPSVREDRGSGLDAWSSRKYRERPSSPASMYSRRDDERRVELRDSKSQPSSPRSSSGIARSKVVHGSPNSQGVAPWTGSRVSEPPKQNVEFTDTWMNVEYDRSRSETPTRDENLDSIGEIIIKQPSALPEQITKQEVPKSADDSENTKSSSKKSTVPKSRTGSRTSSSHSEAENVKRDKPEESRAQLLQRVRSTSPPSDEHKKKNREKDLKRSKSDSKPSKSRRVASQNDSDSDQHQQAKKKAKYQTTKSSKSESYRKSSESHEKTGVSALIKREFSPTVTPRHRQDVTKFSHERKPYKDGYDVPSKKQSRYPHESKKSDAMFHKKRRHSQSGKDSDDSAVAYGKEGRGSVEHDQKSRRHKESSSEPARPGKRSRRASYKHEAPMPVASQSFQEENEDENASTGVDSDAKEPSSYFRPRVVVKEEVVEVMPEESDDDEVASPSQQEASFVNEETVEIEEESSSESEEEESEENNEDKSPAVEADKIKRKSRWEPEAVKVPPKVAIAQPFNRAFHPLTSKPIIEGQKVTKEEYKESAIFPDAGDSQSVSEPKKEKLSRLEEEKAQLQVLLSKLDSKEKLKGEDATKVADIFISDIKNKLKSQLHTKKEREPKVEESEITAAKVETALEDVVQEETIQEEAFEEIVEIEQAPDIIEEQTIVEEVQSNEIVLDPEIECSSAVKVSSYKDLPSDLLFHKHSEDLDSRQGYRKQMEAKRSEKMKRSKDKELRSLLRKQKKERERQKRRIERMRGPSQNIISSIDDAEEEIDTDDESQKESPVLEEPEGDSVKKEVSEEKETIEFSPLTLSQQTLHETVHALEDDPHQQSSNVCKSVGRDDVAVTPHPVSSEQNVAVSEPAKDVILPVSQAIFAELKSDFRHAEKVPFAVPSSRENLTPSNLTPKSLKNDENSVSPLSQVKNNSTNDSKPSEKSRQPTMKTPSASSPYTPKSTSSSDKLQFQGAESSSISSSPKVKPAPPTMGHTSLRRMNSKQDRHGSGDRRAQEQMERKHRRTEHPSQVEKQHPDRQLKSKHPVSSRAFTNLTVSSSISPSEPLGQKELETLRAELETMKNQLNREMSPGFLSPSSDNDGNLPPISPILKSPTVEREASLTPDTEGKTYVRPVTSPLFLSSPSAITSPVVPASPASSGSSSLTERMKLLVKVKKKVKSEESPGTRKVAEVKEQAEKQKKNEIGNSRFFRSSIFDQDSERLSHLQATISDPAAKETSGRFSLFGGSDLLEDRPLFCSLAEKAAQLDSAQNIPSTASASKNAFSLSSESEGPAPAERTSTRTAGWMDTDEPSKHETLSSHPTVETKIQSLVADQPKVVEEILDSIVVQPTPDNEVSDQTLSTLPPSAIMTESVADSNVTETVASDDVIDAPFDANEVTVEALDVIIESSDVVGAENESDKVSTEKEKVAEDDATMKTTELPSVAKVEGLEEATPDAENSKEMSFQREVVQTEPEMVVDHSDFDLGGNNVVSDDVVASDVVANDVMQESVVYDTTEVVSTEIVTTHEDIYTAPEVGDSLEQNMKVESKVDVVPESLKGLKVQDPIEQGLPAPVQDFTTEQKNDSSDVSAKQISEKTETKSSSKTADSGGSERGSSDVANVSTGSASAIAEEETSKKIDREKKVTVLPQKQIEQIKSKSSRSDDSKQSHAEVSKPIKKSDNQSSSHSAVAKKHSSSMQPHKSELKTIKTETSDSKDKKTSSEKRIKPEKLKKEHRKQTVPKDTISKSESKSEKSSLKTSHSKMLSEKHSGKFMKKSEKHAGKSDKQHPIDVPSIHSKTSSSEAKAEISSTKLEQPTKPEKSKLEQKSSQKLKAEKVESSESKSTKPHEKADKPKQHDTVIPKHHKVSDKKSKSLSLDSEKKPKASHMDAEKKRDLKLAKPIKDTKDGKAAQLIHKKQKSEEAQKGKVFSETKSVKSSSSLPSKKSFDVKPQLKAKLKSKDSVPSIKPGEKTKVKPKHNKPSTESDQPVKKRPKLDDSSDFFGKKLTPKVQSKPFMLNFDSDDDSSAKAVSQEQRSKPSKTSSSTVSSDSVSRPGSHSTQQPKSLSQPITKPTKGKSSFISSDSDSEDNYDSFISQMGGGSSMMTSSTQRKAPSPMRQLALSTDDSDSSESEVTVKKVDPEPRKTERKQIHKAVKSLEHYDSDRSDKSASKTSKLSQQQSKSKEQKSKLIKESSPSYRSEKSKKLLHDKKSKTKSKLKKVEKVESCGSDSEDPYRKPKSRPEKSAKILDSDSSSDEKTPLEKKTTVHVSSVKKSQQRSKKGKDTFPAADSVMPKHKKHKPTSSDGGAHPVKLHEKSSSHENVRKFTSSSEEDSLHPPPSPTSSFLTIQTIKDESIIPPEYMDQFSMQDTKSESKPPDISKSSYHESLAHKIYTSSSSSDSDSDFDDKVFETISKEESLKFLGELSESSNSSSEFSDDERITGFDVKSSSKLQAKHSRPEKPEAKTVKLKKTPKEMVDEKDHSKSQGDAFKGFKPSSSSKPSEHKKEISKSSQKHHKSHDLKQSVKTSGIKDKKLKQEIPFKTSRDKSELALEKSKPTFKSQDVHKFPKKSKLVEDKHTKDKSSKLVHKDKAAGDKMKKQSDKKTDGAKSSHSEKSHKPLLHDITKKSADKQKHHKDIADHAKSHHHSSGKSKSKEQFKSKHSKDVGHSEAKSMRTPKLGQDVMKQKKDSKTKSSIIPEKKLSKQKFTVPHEKREKKRSPKPEKPFDTKSLISKEEEFLPPDLQIDESPEKKILQQKKIDDSMPGKRFFCSDSSSDEEDGTFSSSSKLFIPQSPGHLKDEDVQISKFRISSQSPSKRLPSPIKLPTASPTHQKSLFSPTEDDDAFSEDRISTLIKNEGAVTSKEHGGFDKSLPRKPSFSLDFGSPSKEHGHTRGHSDTEKQSKSDAEIEEMSKKVERGRSRSRDHSPSDSTKRLSSFERYQLKQKQYREHMTQLNKLSQQRDEEAVRSIMSGDDTSDYLSASATDVPYFGTSGTSNVNQPLNVIREKKNEYQPTSTVSEEPVDSTTKHDEQEKASSVAEVESSPKKIKSATPEPRSTAEEVELAAALRSIEGFGDFTVPAKEEAAPQNVFELDFKQSSSTEQVPGTTDDVDTIAEGREEAEKATTALLQETDSSFFKSKPSHRSEYLPSEDRKETKKSTPQPDLTSQSPSITLPSLQPARDNPTISDKLVQPVTAFLSKPPKSQITQQAHKPDPTSHFSPTKVTKPKVETENFSETTYKETKPLSPKQLEQPPQEVTSSNAVVATERDQRIDDRTITPIKCDSTTDIASDKTGDAKPPLASASSKSTETIQSNPTSLPSSIAPRPFVASLPIHREKPVDKYPPGSPPKPAGVVMKPVAPAGMHPDLPSTAPTRRPSMDLASTASRSTEQGILAPGVASAHAQARGPNIDTRITSAQQPPHLPSGHNVGSFVSTTHQHGFSQPSWIPHFSPTHPTDNASHAFASTNPPSGGTFKFPSTQTVPTTLMQPPFASTSPQVSNVSPRLDRPQQPQTPTSNNQAQLPNTSKGLSPHPQGQLHPGLPVSTPNRPYPSLASPSASQPRTPLASPKMAAPTTNISRPPILQSPVTASGPGGHIAGFGFEQAAGMQVSSHPQSVAVTTVPTATPPNRPPASAAALMLSQTSAPATNILSEKMQTSFEGLQARLPIPQVSHHPLPTSIPESFPARHQQPGNPLAQDVKISHRFPAQVPTDPDHTMAQYSSRQPVFYPPGIAMLPYGMPSMRHGVSFPRSSPYGGYGLPMPLTHGMSPQQPRQPPGPSHLFQPRTHNPFADLRSQHPTGQTQTQAKPSAIVTHPTLQQPQQHSIKGKTTLSSNTPHSPKMAHKPPPGVSGLPEFPVRSQEMRFNYPAASMGGELGQAVMNASSGDSSMDMVTHHFLKSLSGVRPPATQSPMSAGPMTSPGASARPSYSPQQQYRPPHTNTSMSVGASPSPQEGARPPHPGSTSEMYQRAPTPLRGQHIPPQPPFWPPSAHSQTGKVEPQLGPGQPQMDIYPQHRGGPPKEPSTVVIKQKPQESSQDPLQDLFQRYPIIWQGNLALKNDLAAVQIHYVCGNLTMAQAALPSSDPNDLTGLSVLRIIQRMRINPEQMEPLCRRMTRLEEFCVLLALPCGRDKDDVGRQTTALSTGFIQYLQQKQVAGIVNLDGVVESTQQRIKLVLHVFPPCEFTNEHLQFRAPDLLSNVADIHHLMIVVTST